MSPYMTRNDSIQKGGHADVRPDRAGADMNVEPFAFRPLQLVALVDTKSLDNLESLGGVEALLDGLGTDGARGLRTTKQSGSPDPDPGIWGINDAVTHLAWNWRLCRDRPQCREQQVSEALLVWTVPLPSKFQHRKRYKVYRAYMNIISFLDVRESAYLSLWPALHNKVLVSLKIYHTVSLDLISISQTLLSIAPRVSLDLSVFLNFAQSRPGGVPPWIGLNALLSSWPSLLSALFVL
jgi:hypothetical protein